MEYSDMPFTSETDYEKLSYGKLGFKRIQRLRKKGKRRGITVPPLGFELTKPEKPRIAFWIAAIAGMVIFIGILVCAGFAAKFGIDFFSTQFKDGGGFFKTLFNPAVFFGTGGLSAIPAILIISAYLLLALIFIVPIIIALYCYRYARNTLYLARCSKEEFAKGEIVFGHIINYIVALVVATIILIVSLVTLDLQPVKTVLILIYVGFVIIFGGLLTLIILEKVKCTKWFETLDEFKKENYLAHERALRRVRSRLKFDRQVWNDFGR